MESLDLIFCAVAAAALDICIFVLIITAYREKRSTKKNWRQISSDMELAEQESCIIHGRCGNFLLQGRPDVLRVFIHAPLEARRDRVAAFSLTWSEREILRHIRVEDKRRAAYYHYYTGEDWRDAAGYDLCLDSSLLGEDGCVERILQVLPFYT